MEDTDGVPARAFAATLRFSRGRSGESQRALFRWHGTARHGTATRTLARRSLSTDIELSPVAGGAEGLPPRSSHTVTLFGNNSARAHSSHASPALFVGLPVPFLSRGSLEPLVLLTESTAGQPAGFLLMMLGGVPC